MKRIPELVFEVLRTIARWFAGHPAIIISVLAAVAVFYGVLWGLTVKIRTSTVDFLETALDSEVKVSEVVVTPSLQIKLSDVIITSNNSTLKLPDLKADKIFITANIPSMIRGEVDVVEVILFQPHLFIYSDGPESNISRRFSKFTECNSEDISLPGKLEIRQGHIIVEPPPGSHWSDSREVAVVEGVVGKTEQGDIGVAAKVTAFSSIINVKGTVSPCTSTRALAIEANSSVFDFSQFQRETSDMLSREENMLFSVAGGTGKMSLTVEGSLKDPYFSGGISTREFDARFSFMSKFLNITDFKSGVGSERISGSGDVDFNLPEIPFQFSISIDGMDVSRIFNNHREKKLMYSPKGDMTGVFHVSGSLRDSSMMIDRGNVTVTNGLIKLPDPDIYDSAALRPPAMELPIKEINARFKSRGNSLEFTSISFEGENWLMRGSLNISDPVSPGGIGRNTRFEASLKVSSTNLQSLTEKFRFLKGHAGGEMEGSINLSGKLGTAEELSGSGRLKIKNGFMGNPYGGKNGVVAQAIDFDIAEFVFNLGGGALYLEKSDISGEGVDIFSSGTIGYDGRIEFSVRARLSPERARDFNGLVPYLASTDMISLVTYRAECQISGTLLEPESDWTRPELTRW